MIEVIQKIHTDERDPHSLFAQVTIDSIANNAILMGHNFTDSRTVVYLDEIDNLCTALQLLKSKYL